MYIKDEYIKEENIKGNIYIIDGEEYKIIEGDSKGITVNKIIKE
jgi:hypothetical protein